MLLSRIISFAAFTIILELISLGAWGQCHPGTGTERFSSVRHVPTLPGLAGIELILNDQGNQVTAVLSDYEGLTSPLKTRLTGKLDGCKVTLAGKNQRGPVEIRGRLTIAAFQGHILRQIGRRWYTETVSLRRKLAEDPDFVASAKLALSTRRLL